jgi:hypothetical protein
MENRATLFVPARGDIRDGQPRADVRHGERGEDERGVVCDVVEPAADRVRRPFTSTAPVNSSAKTANVGCVNATAKFANSPLTDTAHVIA